MRTAAILTCALLSISYISVCHGYIAAPLIGYQQGLELQVSPGASTAEQCRLFGVPTPYGYAATESGPLFLYTPQNTGNHILSFTYDSASYIIYPVIAPGDTTLQIDAADQNNPLINFDSTKSPPGQSGAVTIYLVDKNTGADACSVQIQVTNDQPLTCLPGYGGNYPPGGGGGGSNPIPPPPGAGTWVLPGGSVYAPTYVTNIIIQQFVNINNININIVVNNVIQISNSTLINKQVEQVPPAPRPINCTTEPTNPSCTVPPGTSQQTIPAVIPPGSIRIPPPTIARPPPPTTSAPIPPTPPFRNPPPFSAVLPPRSAAPATGRRLRS